MLSTRIGAALAMRPEAPLLDALLGSQVGIEVREGAEVRTQPELVWCVGELRDTPLVVLEQPPLQIVVGHRNTISQGPQTPTTRPVNRAPQCGMAIRPAPRAADASYSQRSRPASSKGPMLMRNSGSGMSGSSAQISSMSTPRSHVCAIPFTA